LVFYLFTFWNAACLIAGASKAKLLCACNKASSVRESNAWFFAGVFCAGGTGQWHSVKKCTHSVKELPSIFIKNIIS